MKTYSVIDNKTKSVISTHKTYENARRKIYHDLDGCLDADYTEKRNGTYIQPITLGDTRYYGIRENIK